MGSVIHNHPSMDSARFEHRGVVSSYNGLEIFTGRKGNNKIGYGDLDPMNTRLHLLIKDKLDLSEMDNEELSYGIPRCDDGKFSAKAAWQAQCVVPKKIQDKMLKELYRRANGKLHGALLGSIDSIIEMATSAHVDDQVRFKAATYILERLQGKTPDVIVHEQSKPWEVVLAGVERGPRPPRKQVEDGNTVDAEVVEDGK